MHRPGQMFGSFQLALDKRLVDDYLGGDVRQFTFLPCFYLLARGVKVALHSIHTDRDTVDKRE